MSGTSAQEIGIVDYPGAQGGLYPGPNRFLWHPRLHNCLRTRAIRPNTALRVTHWKPIDSFDADLSHRL